MKIVDRKTFLSIAGETLFSKYEPCVFDGLSIKCDTVGENDFIYQDIPDAVRCSGTDELFDILYRAEHDGESFSMDFNCAGRDGCFDDEQLFVVWERDDVIALIERLSKVASALTAPSSPPPSVGSR